MIYLKFFFISLSALNLYLGLSIINDPKQSLSIFRVVVFGYGPIILSILFIFILFKKKITTILFNTIILLALGVFSYEIFFIYSQNQKIKKINSKITLSEPTKLKNEKPPQICPVNLWTERDLDLYPVGGISNTKITKQNSITKNKTIRKSDKYGFNNKAEVWNFKNTFAIFIGDSFAYGADVTHDEGYVELFKKKFPNTINLGCGGNGPISELASFVEYAKILKPKYIIWNYYENDITKDLTKELLSPYKKYLDKNFNQDLLNKQSKIDEILTNFWNNNKNNTIKKNLKLNSYSQFYKLYNLRTNIGLSHGYSNEVFEIFTSILSRVKNETESWGGKLIFVYIPTSHKYKNFISYLDEDYYYKNIEKFLKNEKINLINLDKELKKYGDQENFFYGHFNKEGNELVAKILYEKLLEQ